MHENTESAQEVIPRVIHYCWFGRGKKSKLMEDCIASWSKHCPDWEIVEWNEDNFDPEFCPYAAAAYKKKKYGFLTDAARLKIIYENGGVYLDTDAALLHPPDDLLCNDMWIGYGEITTLNTGSGFGAVPGHPVVKELLQRYLDLDSNAEFELCTQRDTRTFRELFPDFAADHAIGQEFLYTREGHSAQVLVINNIWYYVRHHYMNTWLPRYKRMYNRVKIRWLKFKEKRND